MKLLKEQLAHGNVRDMQLYHINKLGAESPREIFLPLGLLKGRTYSEYLVSDRGRIFSIKTMKFLSFGILSEYHICHIRPDDPSGYERSHIDIVHWIIAHIDLIKGRQVTVLW